jgi:hypothetical protein
VGAEVLSAVNVGILSFGLWRRKLCWMSADVSDEPCVFVFRSGGGNRSFLPTSYLFLPWLTLRPWRWKHYVAPKRRWTLRHCTALQPDDIVLFIAISGELQTQHRIYCHDLGVTVDGVWIGEWIYWPLIHTNWNYKWLQRYRWVRHFTDHLAHAKFSQSSLVVS